MTQTEPLSEGICAGVKRFSAPTPVMSLSTVGINIENESIVLVGKQKAKPDFFQGLRLFVIPESRILSRSEVKVCTDALRTNRIYRMQKRERFEKSVGF